MKIDETAYINIETGEIVDYPEKFVHCDSLIAPVISVLNAKGYKTIASCQGHSQRLTVSNKGKCKLYHDVPIEDQIRELLYEMYITHRIIVINSIDQEYINFEFVSDGTNVYIAFGEEYSFPSLPKDFTLLRFRNGISISKFIRRDKEDGTMKTEGEMYKEILLTNQELIRWANTLEINKGVSLT